MNFELMELPYKKNALSPFIGEETVSIHHQKHHGGYLKKLDAALADDPRRDLTLAEVVTGSAGTDAKVFNLAAQVWNHDFYWNSLAASATASPEAEFLDAINTSFGSLDAMLESFSSAAAGHFGSGWAWLVYLPKTKRASADVALEICSTSDAGNPLTDGKVPLLTLDVWEHAYYLDYQNERPRYIKTFLEGHANWSFASDNYTLASAG